MADSSVTSIHYDERHSAIKVSRNSLWRAAEDPTANPADFSGDWKKIANDMPETVTRPGRRRPRPVFAIKYRQRAAPRFFDAPKMPVKRFAAPLYRLWGMLDRQEGRFRPISRVSRTRENIGPLCCERSANQLTLPRLKISRFARANRVQIAFLCKHSRYRD